MHPGEDLLRELCAFNSHTDNPAGVARAAEIAMRELRRLGAATIERLDVPPAETVDRDGTVRPRPLGPAVRAVFNPDAPRRVLLSIHLDTVHPPESPFRDCRPEGHRLIGPGVVDAKGGLVVLLLALERFLATPMAWALGVEVLLNPDEEIGSPSSRALLEESARRCVAGLVFEPSLPDGALVSARKGSGNYVLVARGRSAHAGRDFSQGRNALTALCEVCVITEKMNNAVPGLIVNVGVIEGGTAPNVVPDTAVARLNVRVDQPALGDAFDRALRHQCDATARERDLAITVRGGLGSPPRPEFPTLMALALEQAEALGLNLPPPRPTGGACDGNKLAAAGLPVLDSLGPVGGELHSDREYVELPSLAPRAALTAGLLHRLALGHELPTMAPPPEHP